MKYLTKENIKIGLISVVVVLLIINLITVLTPRKPINNTSEIIKAKDEVIQSVIREREIYRQWKDDAISELQKRDSVLTTQYKTKVIQYEKVPINVRNYSNDELRRAVENFQ